METNQPENIVSILVPAYNQPEYTRKTLDSIVKQKYRPIEVILSDDCSPTTLEPIAKEFGKFEDSQFSIRYFRQSSNLGVMPNFTFTVEQATGRYLVPFAHDNRFIDKNFLSEAVEMMQQHPECAMCAANAVLENRGDEMLSLPENIDAKDSWVVLEGDAFIRLWRRGGLGYTQALVLDSRLCHSLSAFKEPFLVSGAMARSLDLAHDNAFAYVFILSSVGSVALTGKVVCEVGTPKDSYSRGDEKWKQTRAKVKFIIFYNIYRANLAGKYAQAAKKAAKRQALAYIDYILDPKIMRYYHYGIEIILLMCLSLLRRPWFLLRLRFKRAKRKIRGLPPKSKLMKY